MAARDVCPDWSRIARSETPAVAPWVNKPALRLCAANFLALVPAATRLRFTTSATIWSLNLLSLTSPCVFTERKRGPSSRSASSIHACTGEVSACSLDVLG